MRTHYVLSTDQVPREKEVSKTRSESLRSHAAGSTCLHLLIWWLKVSKDFPFHLEQNLSTSSWSWGSDLASACLCDPISHYFPPGSLNSRHIALLCVSGLVWVCLCLSVFALASSTIYNPPSPVILGLAPLHLSCLGSNLMFPLPLPHFNLSSSESNFEVCVAFLKV